MEFRVLGALEVLHADRALPLGGRKQRAVLARLLLDAGQAVSADALISAVWGENPPAHAGGRFTSMWPICAGCLTSTTTSTAIADA